MDQAGLTTLSKLSKKTKDEIVQLHGMGPGTIPTLRSVLKAKELSYQKR